MGTHTKANSLMDICKALVSAFMPMEISTRVNGFKTSPMVMELLATLIKATTKETFTRAKDKDGVR